MRRIALAALALWLAIQLVPYGWWHENPPIADSAVWPDSESEQIARSSCYDCHSNETQWPPHAYVAPMSWLVRRDVEEGRDELNFSDWNPSDADEAAEEVRDGTMPPLRYTLVHRDARLTDEEASRLMDALTAMEDRS